MDVIISILYFSRLFRRRSGRCSDTKDEDNSELDKEFAEHCNVGRKKNLWVSSELNRSGLIRFKCEGIERIFGCLAWHDGCPSYTTGAEPPSRLEKREEAIPR